MKVLIVSEAAGPRGGAEKVAVATALALADRGHDVTLLGGCGPVAAEALAHPTLRHVVVFEQDPGEPEGRLDKLQALWKKLPRRIIEEELERLGSEGIAHVHGAYHVLSPSVYGPIMRHPRVVYTHHEYGMACPTMGFYDYKRACVCPEVGGSWGCVKRDCVIGTRRIKTIATLRHALAFRQTHAKREIAAHVFVSRFSESILSPYLPVDAVRRVVYNPSELVDEGPAEIAEDASFVFVGRMTIEKGPDLFCAACRRLGVAPVLVGDGPLREQIEREYPEARVTGWLPPHEVAEIVRTARALVLASLWYETAGMVVTEALCRGVPVVIPDISAAQEFVEEGVDGFLFRAADVDDLAEKLRRLQDIDLVRQMGRAGYDRYWADPPSTRRYVQEIEDVYRNVP